VKNSVAVANGTVAIETVLSAALLRSQLKKLPAQHALRNENARYLADRLNSIDGITVMKLTDGAEEIGYYISIHF
jgi:dTDP-4-amino-4,6-dideoxygalactose transaminase